MGPSATFENAVNSGPLMVVALFYGSSLELCITTHSGTFHINEIVWTLHDSLVLDLQQENIINKVTIYSEKVYIKNPSTVQHGCKDTQCALS